MTKKILDKESENDRFQIFLMNIDDVVDEFIEEAERLGFEFDFSEYSLDMLENYYLRRESELNQDEKRKNAFIESAARYLGETLIKNYGGDWALAIDDPKNFYYGLPIINGHSKYGVDFCPHETFRMFTRRKTHGFLRKVIQNDINPVRLELTPE
jgi:hypothetical protein